MMGGRYGVKVGISDGGTGKSRCEFDVSGLDSGLGEFLFQWQDIPSFSGIIDLYRKICFLRI